MTSRELIKTSGIIVLSLIIHFLIFQGIPYQFSPDIRFTRKKTEMKLRPFRPTPPPIPKILDKSIQKGSPSPGIAGDMEDGGGKNLEMESVGETKKAETPDSNELALQEVTGNEVDKSILSDFLAMIKSESYQDKMRDIEKEKKHMWKGKGVSTKDLSGLKGNQAGDGKFQEGYLDPRVKLVVASYPPSRIEKDHPPIVYPDMKVKKHELQSGWCNVVIRIYTDRRGKVRRRFVLRPKDGGVREKLFLAHTLDAVKGWGFEGKEVEIIIDVRYFVE